MRWVQLTNYNTNEPIHINLHHAVTMCWDSIDHYTEIETSHGVYRVTQTPDEIRHKTFFGA